MHRQKDPAILYVTFVQLGFILRDPHTHPLPSRHLCGFSLHVDKAERLTVFPALQRWSSLSCRSSSCSSSSNLRPSSA